MITFLTKSLTALDDNIVGFANTLLETRENIFVGDVNSLRFINNSFLVNGVFYHEKQGVNATWTAESTVAIETSEIIWLFSSPADVYGLDIWSLLFALSQFAPMVNNPATLLLVKNKAFVSCIDRQHRPELIVSPLASDHQTFSLEHERSIIKLLGEDRGKGVFIINPEDSNARVIQELLTGNTPDARLYDDPVNGIRYRFVTSQEALPQHIEYRIILCAGNVIGAYGKKPSGNDHRLHLRHGSTFQAVKDYELCFMEERWTPLAKKLQHLGINYCGIDVLNERVIELNPMNPGGLWRILAEEEKDLFPKAWSLIHQSLFGHKPNPSCHQGITAFHFDTRSC